MKSISIIVGFRNRDETRVRRSLESLKYAIEKSSVNVELIFVDYGSTPELSLIIEGAVSEFGFAKYIHCETRGLAWSRAHALNVGLKISENEWVLFSDIDMLYSEFSFNSLATIKSAQCFYNLRCYYLPEYDDFLSLSKKKSTLKLSDDSALGLMLVNKTSLEAIGAYDEFFKFWGGEDYDLSNRLKMFGLNHTYLENEDQRLFHQWHPASNNLTDGFMPPGFWYDIEFYIASNSCIKRNETYGELMEYHHRPSLLILDTCEFDSEKVDAYSEIMNRKRISDFISLEKGEFSVYEWNSIKAKNSKLMLLINKLFGKMGANLLLKYKENIFRNSVMYFINNHRELVLDYYIDDSMAILVRR
ncbi:glycosyltransferase family 2 protein [Vibrio sp. TRT 2004]|uniref:glycosyltransferase family 2 protein n=1 Tax=Vibrio sp. TRT 2004 TaxID=3418506 RepID=UPI003CF45BBC